MIDSYGNPVPRYTPNSALPPELQLLLLQEQEKGQQQSSPGVSDIIEKIISSQAGVKAAVKAGSHFLPSSHVASNIFSGMPSQGVASIPTASGGPGVLTAGGEVVATNAAGQTPMGAAFSGYALPAAGAALGGYGLYHVGSKWGEAGSRTPKNVGKRVGQGAASGATLGASVGSVVPGIGTVIGGGVGAIAGGLLGLGSGLVHAGRHKDHAERSRFRDELVDRGFYERGSRLGGSLADAYTQGNPTGTYVQLSDGSYYDVSGERKRAGYNAPWKVGEETAADHLLAGEINPLTTLLAGGKKNLAGWNTGYLTNAARSNSAKNDREDVLGFYKRAGLTDKRQVTDALSALHQAGKGEKHADRRLGEWDMYAMQNAANSLFDNTSGVDKTYGEGWIHPSHRDAFTAKNNNSKGPVLDNEGYVIEANTPGFKYTWGRGSQGQR